MTRETKVGLLVGMGVILLIGIIVSDHLSMAQKQAPPDMTDYGRLAQNSLNAEGTGMESLQRSQETIVPPAPVDPLPTPQQFDNYPPSQLANQTNTSQNYTQNQDNHSDRTDPQPISRGSDSLAIRGSDSSTLRTLPGIEDAQLASVTITNNQQVRTTGPQPSIHYVQRGETLYSIAARYYNNGELWNVIKQANPQTVGADNKVNIGARLLVPNKALLPDLLRQNPQAADILAPVLGQLPSGINHQSAPLTVVVKPQDTLSGLASEHLGSARKWNELLQANKDLMDKPEDLRVGMVIKIPRSQSDSSTPGPVPAVVRDSGSQIYVVQAGDTLSSIAQSKLSDRNQWDKIYQANRDQLESPSMLKVGMKLKIPAQR